MAIFTCDTLVVSIQKKPAVISYNPASKLVLFQTGAFLPVPAVQPDCMYFLYIPVFSMVSRAERFGRYSKVRQKGRAE
jgi:hypothetical protein